MFFAFFCVLYKRIRRSFPFFIKERGVIKVISHNKNCKSRKTKNVKERSIFCIRLKKNILFSIYIYIYIYIYILTSAMQLIYCLNIRGFYRKYIRGFSILAGTLLTVIIILYIATISIYVYWNKECNVLRSFAKERNVLALFYVLCKTHCVLCVLLRSLQKNVAFFVLFSVLKKRTEKNASFFWVS